MKKIFTLGTGRRNEEDFIEILFAYDIKALIDVRRFQKSKNSVFTRQNFEKLLKESGIEYVCLGNELGGFRKNGYTAYALTEEFRQGIEKLETIAKNMLSVIMCAEKFPWKCHRKWISKELHNRGWLVGHIIDKGNVWLPK